MFRPLRDEDHFPPKHAQTPILDEPGKERADGPDHASRFGAKVLKLVKRIANA